MVVQSSETIAELNDAFRRSVRNTTITSGVWALPDMNELLAAVRAFKSFTEDNDPYGEHDFGVIDWHGTTIYWKIDYYDQMLQCWHDPLSSDCYRVLTVMLSDEY